MSFENDNRAEGFANENAGRDGGYRSYNRYNNDGEQRTHRPRVGSYNREGGERPYRSSYNNRGNYGDRPQRPRFNAEDGEQRSFRPRTNYNREGGEQRSFRPRTNYNREGGYSSDRPQRPRYNAEGGEQRSFRPRTGSFHTEGGYSSDRPQRPRFQGGDQPRGARPQRPRTAGYNPNAKYSMKKQIEYKDILTDPNEPVRLNKFLANAGICPRREADEFIAAGVCR
jgi:23S rRNA pseudouridine2605 synthase